MNKRLVAAILILLAKNCAADDATGNLTIQVNGLLHERGQVVANLFREGDDVMKIGTAYLHTQVMISDKHAHVVFKDLKYGKYAISVFHDENGDGKLDHNLLRLPAEPLGFSNGFQLGLVSGPPSFERLQVVFKRGAESIAITVK